MQTTAKQHAPLLKGDVFFLGGTLPLAGAEERDRRHFKYFFPNWGERERIYWVAVGVGTAIRESVRLAPAMRKFLKFSSDSADEITRGESEFENRWMDIHQEDQALAILSVFHWRTISCAAKDIRQNKLCSSASHEETCLRARAQNLTAEQIDMRELTILREFINML